MTSLPLPISTNLLYKVGDGLAGRVIHSTYKRINKFFPVEISPQYWDNSNSSQIRFGQKNAGRLHSKVSLRSSVLCPLSWPWEYSFVEVSLKVCRRKTET